MEGGTQEGGPAGLWGTGGCLAFTRGMGTTHSNEQKGGVS